MLRRSIGLLKGRLVRHNSRHIGLGLNYSGDRLVDLNVVPVQRLRGVSIKLDTGLCIICHGAHQSGFGLSQVALILQYSQRSRCAKAVFLLLGIQGLSGKIKVTGLGLPSELAGYVQKGVVPKFAIWNPIDLGYAATQIATRLARGADAGKPVSIGRMGEVTFGADGIGAMSKPFVYDASNVAAG